MQVFLEGLTATHDAKFFLEEADRLGNPLRDGIRGSPLNHGSALQAIHPVIRTSVGHNMALYRQEKCLISFSYRGG